MPTLTPDDLEATETLWAKVEQVLHNNDDLRHRQHAIEARHGPLQRMVSPNAWKTFLKIEESITARSSEALLVVSRWAFWAGYRAASRLLGEQRGAD